MRARKGDTMFWKDKYELGVLLLDQQHRELFGRVEAFMQALRSDASWDAKVRQVNQTLEFMKSYVVEHFRDEEAYQTRIGYPGYEAHRKLHAGMVQYVVDMAAEYERRGFDEQLMQQFGGRLLAWLINHVASEDQHIADYAREKGWLAMSDKIYAPFLEATRNVFQLMMDLSDVYDRPAETFLYEDALDIVIGITGDLTGEVVYRFPRETSLRMVNIMSGIEMDTVDEFVTSAISEIANIISGNVITMFSGDDIRCDILPPALRRADDGGRYTLRTACCICTAAGEVCLDIRLNISRR